MKLYDDLVWRGLIKDVAGDNLEEVLNGEPITFYWGTDPTADSLHIGHYSSLVTAKRLAKYGHHPILLCGGATGRIGDPRPTAEREILSYETVDKNIKCIKNQIDRLFEGKAELVDNYSWTKDYTFLEFLRDIGKYININYMLSKDIIQRRLESGITYAEFSYMLLQGYDFMHLYETKNCIMQVEGSDQWGNITTGIELIRKKLGKEAYGFTMPLLTKSDGTKFGKTNGKAIWLDINKTSAYEMYQFFINSEDDKVIDYLKFLTFLTPEEIMELEEKNKTQPHLREAHQALAREVITFIHGRDAYDEAVKISHALFSGDIKALTAKEIEMGFGDLPSINLHDNLTLVDALIEASLAKSKREAREFIQNGAVSLNGDKCQDLEHILSTSDAIEGKFIVIRRGKKLYALIKC